MRGALRQPAEHFESALKTFAGLVLAAAAKATGEEKVSTSVEPRMDGTLRIALTGRLRAVVDWIDVPDAEARAGESVGRLVLREGSEAFGSAALKAVRAACLLAVRDPRYALLTYANRGLREFVCDDGAMDRLIARRLTPARTELYGFVFERADEDEGPVYRLHFARSDGARLEALVSTPNQLTRPLQRIGPMEMGVNATGPEGQGAPTGEAAVHRAVVAVSFLLARALHDRMSLDVPPRSAKDKEYFEGGEGDANKPISSADFVPEAAWRRFFTPFEIERDAISDFQLLDPAVMIQHGELECNYIQPSYEGALKFHRPLWKFEKLIDCEQEGFSTYLGDVDLIYGGSDKLDRLLSEIRSSKGGERFIFFNETCVSRIVGDDVRRSIKRHEQAGGAPVVTLDITLSSPGAILADMVRQFKALAENDGSTGKTGETVSVALIGYPLDRGAVELGRLLDSLGLGETVFLLPQMGTTLLRKARDARLVVSAPVADWKAIAAEIAGEEKPLLTLPLPYGVEGVRRWGAAILDALGLGEGCASLDARCDEIKGRFEREIAPRTQGCGLGFVLAKSEMSRLVDPTGLFGIPVVRFLDELGFGLHIFLYTGEAAKDAPEAASQLGALVSDESRLRVTPFSDQATLAAALREASDVQAVYSQYSFDRRLLNVGKATWSLHDLEKGLEGALRTAERLARRCAWTGPAKWGAHVRARGWADA